MILWKKLDTLQGLLSQILANSSKEFSISEFLSHFDIYCVTPMCPALCHVQKEVCSHENNRGYGAMQHYVPILHLPI